MGNKPVRVAKFAMNELKRHYKKKGPSADDKKFKAMQKRFEYAMECVKEREMQVQRWVDDGAEAWELVEHIKAGGSPW